MADPSIPDPEALQAARILLQSRSRARRQLLETAEESLEALLEEGLSRRISLRAPLSKDPDPPQKPPQLFFQGAEVKPGSSPLETFGRATLALPSTLPSLSVPLSDQPVDGPPPLPETSTPLLNALRQEVLLTSDAQEGARCYGLGVLAAEAGELILAEAALNRARRGEFRQAAEQALERILDPEARLELALESGRWLRAGFLAWETGALEQALKIWGGAEAPESWLSRYALQLRRLDWEGAAASLEPLLATVGGPLWAALVMERLRLGEELGEADERLDLRFREALDRMGPTPLLLAEMERSALERDRPALLHWSLRAQAQEERSAELLYRLSRSLETLGRAEEALQLLKEAALCAEAAPQLMERALSLSRRLNRPELERDLLLEQAQRAETAQAEAEARYQAARLALRLGDEKGGRAQLQRALQADPAHRGALAALGRRSSPEEIIRRYELEIEQLNDPKVQERQHLRLIQLLEPLQPERALAQIRLLLRMDPTQPMGLYRAEVLLAQRGAWAELLALLLEAAEQDPGPEQTGLLLAAEILRLFQGDDASAGRLYARILDGAPEHPLALRRAYEIFGRLGHRGARLEAAVRLGRALGDPRLLLQAAQLQLQEGEPEAAQLLFMEVLELDPKASEAIEALIQLSAQLGHQELLEELNPQEPELRARLAEALLAGGSPEAALLLLEQLEPQPPELLLLRCAIMEALGGWERERAKLLEIRAPLEGPQLWIQAALIWLSLGEGDACLHALEAAGEEPEAHALLERLKPPRSPDPLREARHAQRAGDLKARDAALRSLVEQREAVALLLDPLSLDPQHALEALQDNPRDSLNYERGMRALNPDQCRRLSWVRLEGVSSAEGAQLLTRIGASAWEVGAEQEARRAAETLLQRDPDSLSARLRLRALALARGEAAEALIQGEALLKLLRSPTRGAALRLELAQEAPERALPWLREALALQPNAPEIQAALKEAQEREEREEERETQQADLQMARRLKLEDPERAESLLRERLEAGDLLAWEVMGEIAAAQGDHRRLLETLRFRFEQLEEPQERAALALSMAEVFSRELNLPRMAAGWFKRAVELDPGELEGIWRLLAEQERAPEQIPIAHIEDALERSLKECQARLDQQPGQPELLRHMAKLLFRIQDVERCQLICATLSCLGEADEGARRFLELNPPQAPLQPEHSLSKPLLELLQDPSERSLEAQRYIALASQLPGRPLSRGRAPGPWPGWCVRVAHSLGLGGLQLFPGERLEAHPGPRPALNLPPPLLKSPLSPGWAALVAREIEGLRGGRCRLLQGDQEALMEQLERLSSQLKRQQRSRGGLSLKPPKDLSALRAALRRTQDRCALLYAGDPGAALSALFELEPGPELQAQLQKGERGQALLRFLSGSSLPRLRRALLEGNHDSMG